MLGKFKAVGLLSLCMLATASQPAAAADFPDRPIRWVVTYPAGGVADLGARLVSAAPTMKLNGQPYVVDNRPGAGGSIGFRFIATSKPDGYTIGNIDTGFAISGLTRTDLQYKLDDFTYIGGVFVQPMMLTVRPDLPAANLKEALDYIKRAGDKSSYGTWGVGTSNHLAGEDLGDRLGVRSLAVPFPGSSGITAALMGKELDFAFLDVTTAKAMAADGRVRILAISSATRLASSPDVPAIAEVLPGFDYVNFQGVAAPKGLPPEVQKMLTEALQRTLNQPEMRKDLEARGLTPWPSSARELQELVMTQYEKGKAIMVKRNIKLN